MTQERYAIIEVVIGPLREGTTWHDPALERASDSIANIAHSLGSSVGDGSTSGIIRTIDTADHLGLGAGERSPDEVLARIAHYVSTYCLHDKHDVCRLTCKHDNTETCRCHCHG